MVRFVRSISEYGNIANERGRIAGPKHGRIPRTKWDDGVAKSLKDLGLKNPGYLKQSQTYELFL